MKFLAFTAGWGAVGGAIAQYRRAALAKSRRGRVGVGRGRKGAELVASRPIAQGVSATTARGGGWERGMRDLALTCRRVVQGRS